MYRWSEDLCVGDPTIDHQHRELFRIAAKVEELIEESRQYPAGEKGLVRQQKILWETIKYLKSYAVKHFSTEEALQQEWGYKGYEAHKKIHDDFMVKVLQMEEKMCKADCENECIRQFLNWFSEWLYYHIMHKDQEIVKEKRLSES